MSVAVSRRPARLGAALGVTAAVVVLFLITSAVLTWPYIVLLPDRSDEETTVGLGFGTAAMVVTVAALLYFRPPLRSGLLVTVPVLGFVSLLAGFLLGAALAHDFFKLYDFRYRPLIGFNAYLRVSGFHQGHGKGTSYNLDLADFSPSLDLYYDDYRWNVGDRDRVAVTGKCIRVPLQRSGQALRMIQPEHVHAVPCPANPRLLKLG